MIRPHTYTLFSCLVLLLALSACSDVEEYPLSPGPLESPARITDASLQYNPASSQVILTWTAPRFSDEAARLVRYEIRYLYDDKFEWDSAIPILNPPAPLAPGRKQQYRFEHTDPGSLLKVAIVSIDDAQKVSPPGNVSTFQVPGLTLSGRIYDVLTQLPVAGINLDVSGPLAGRQAVTGTDGRFTVANLRSQEVTVIFKDSGAQPSYFGYEHQVVLLADTELEVPFIPYAACELYPAYSILYFFKQACRTSLTPTQLIRVWERMPVPIYIPEFVNEHGVDYRQITLDAVDSWMTTTGITLWEIVDQPQSWGVQMYYKPQSEMGIKVGYTEHLNTTEGLPLRSDISVVDSYADQENLSSVILHELGHTYRLNHLPAGFLMYASHPLPDAPTNDEALILRILTNLPNWTDMNYYQEVSP